MDHCAFHPDELISTKKLSFVKEEVLFRLRLAFEGDAAALAILVPGVRVCSACTAKAIRTLIAKYGKSWKSQTRARRIDAQERELKRERVLEEQQEQEEDIQRFVDVVRAPVFSIVSSQPRTAREDNAFALSPSDTLANIIGASAIAEINLLFRALKYPVEMVLRNGTFPRHSVWQGLASLQPSLPRSLSELIAASPPRLSALMDVMGRVPVFSCAIPSCHGIKSIFEENRPMLLALLGLFDNPEPRLFGRPVNVHRVLSCAASYPNLRWDGETPAALLWTTEMECPAMLLLSIPDDEVPTQLQVRKLIADSLFVPLSIVSLKNEVHNDDDRPYLLENNLVQALINPDK